MTESPHDTRPGGSTSGYKPVRDRARKDVLKKNNVLEMLKIEYVPRQSINPNNWNPNRQSQHDFELLCSSMREDGFTQPVIVLRDSRMIVDGEHRWRASGEVFGETADIPVVFVDMTPEQARIATLRHNRARGEEDIELSAALLRDLREMGALEWAADSLSLDQAELDRMLEDIPAPEALANEEYAPAWEPGERSDGSPFSANGTDGAAGKEGGRRLDDMTPKAREDVRVL